MCYYVSEERISNILGTVEYITNNPYISARTLAKLAGKIISTKFVLGDITQLKTRFIYQCIESRFSWDKKFNINNYYEMVQKIRNKIFCSSAFEIFNKIRGKSGVQSKCGFFWLCFAWLNECLSIKNPNLSSY